MNRSWARSCAVALVLFGALGALRAGAVTTATPVYHGQLGFTPAQGRIDRNRSRGYLAMLKVRQWALIPDANSNGISPGTEPILIAFGDASPYRLEAGQLVESKKGGTWTYHAKGKQGPRAIKMVRIRREADGSYSLRFIVTGIDGSALDTGDPVCTPFAFIIGDDDAFSGINLTSPSFNSRKLRASDLCTADTWEWA